jgi:6-phosphogluconolactonase (cycloisomerase 2 family)
MFAMKNLNGFIDVPARVLAVLCLSILLVIIPIAVTAETTQFAYGVNAADWSMTQYRVNPKTGVLRHNGHLPVIKFPVALSVHPSKRFIITVVKTGNKVAVFRIDPSNGSLEEIPQSPFDVGAKLGAKSPYSVSIHPSGRFVYVAARWGGVVAFTMDTQSGVLALVPGSPFAAQKRTRSVKVHPSGRFVYATNAYSNSISAYRVNEKTGELSPVSGSPFSTGEPGNIPPDLLRIYDAPPEAGGVPYRVDIHPSGRFIYVTNRTGPSLSVLAVDADSGALSPLKSSPFETGGLPYDVAVHPSGRFVYLTSWSDKAVWGYAVDESNGNLTPLSKSPFATNGNGPISISFNAAGNRAYVSNVGSNSITQFSVNTNNGLFSLEEIIRTRYQPFGVALLDREEVVVEKRISYIVKDEKNRLKILRVGKDNLRTSNKKVFSDGSTVEAVVGSREHFVYMAHYGGDKPEESGIAVYRIDTTSGVLALLPEHTFRLGFTPTDLAIDVSGRFLYAVNPSINSLGIFVLDPESGALGLPKSSSPETGKGSVAIALDPAARFSFVANARENTVSVFTHQRILSPAMYPVNREGSTFAVGKNPVALAVDPTGKFLVVANKDSNNLSVFTIHHHEGRLEAVKGSPFMSGKAPGSVVMHPGGKFVYVLNSGSGDISSYHIDPLSGELSVLLQRVDAGTQPVAIFLDSDGRFAYVRSKDANGLRKYAVDVNSGQMSPAGIVHTGPIVTFVN